MNGFSRISLMLLCLTAVFALEISTTKFVVGEIGWINITVNGSVDVGILHERNLSVETNASIEEGITNFGGKGYFVYHIQAEPKGTLSVKVIPHDQQEMIVVTLFNESGVVGFRVDYFFVIKPAEAKKEEYLRWLLILLAILIAIFILMEYIRRECKSGKKWKICKIFRLLKRKVFKK